MTARLLIGVAIALAVALVLSEATLFGIDVWKIVLAIAGVVLFVRARA